TCPPGLFRRRQIERAALPAVQKINHESDSKPRKESDPVHDRQTGHQEQASKNSENWRDGAAGSAEGAVPIRFAIAEDENAGGDECKREKRADVGEIGEGADVEKTCGNTHYEACNPR